MDLFAHAPADHHLGGPAAAQVFVIDGVDGGPLALDHGVGIIGVVAALLEDVDLQGLGIAGDPEEGDGLLHPVAVDVLELDRLDVVAGQRSCVLRSQGRHGLLDAPVQALILGRRLRQSVKLLRRVERASGGHEQQKAQ